MTRATLLGVLALVACAPTLPRYSVHVPPRFDEARPPRRSTLFVSSAIPIDGLEQRLDGVVPRVLETEGSSRLGAMPVHAKLRMERAPVSLRSIERGIELTVRMRGPIELNAGPFRCAASEVTVEASAHGRPMLAGAELVLMGEPRVRVHTEGSLRCGPIDVPVELVVDPVLRLLTRGLDEALGLMRVPIAPVLRLALDELAVPRALRLDDRPMCLDLAPSAIVVAPVGGEGGAVRVRIGADVAPRLSLGECPKTPRPPYDAVLSREQALGDELSVDVAVAVPHAEIEPVLARELVGRRFGAHGRSLTVDDAQLGDAEGRVLVKARVHGAFNGEVYLWGTPALHRTGDRWELVVPDLQAALETKHVLERIELGLWKVLDGGLLEAARRKLHVDVTDRVRSLAERVPKAIDRGFADRVRLHVEGIDLAPLDVLSRPGLLVPIVRLRARATVEVHAP